LRSGKVQFAVLPPELVSKEMDSKLLKSERFVLVGTSRWKGRQLKDIIVNEKAIDFDSSDNTTFSYLIKFGLIDLSKNPRHFVNENDALIKLFVAGVGFGTLNIEIAKPFVERGQLILLNSGKFNEQEHALVWYPRPNKAEYFKKIIRTRN
jgi:hypothetical protein